MPYTPLVSVFVGVTNVIPFFGPFLGAIPSFFLILLVDPIQSLYFLLFVLALQQLSQAADNQKRYAMLRRLGADDGLIARSASQQVALAFLMPLGLALIHSMVGMKAANDIIATAGKVDSVGSSLATAAVLILVYGGYFLATALACRRMARQSWTKLE